MVSINEKKKKEKFESKKRKKRDWGKLLKEEIEEDNVGQQSGYARD